MKTQPRIYYLSGSTVPAPTADSIHVIRMSDALKTRCAQVVLFAKAGGEQSVKEFYGTSQAFDIETVPFTQRWHLGRYFNRLRRLPAPDIAFGRYLYPLCYLALGGTPFIYEVHSPAESFNRWLENWLLRRKQLLGVIFITRALESHYLDAHPELEGKTLVLADAADDPGPSTAVKKHGRLVATYAGSWFQGRGIELLVSLAEAMPDIDFRLAGGTEEELTQRGLSIPDNLLALGYLPPAEVPALLGASDILLAPYAKTVRVHGGRGDTSQWCSPMKIFEYMSHGKAIVCSDLPVLREVLEDGRNCLLAEAESFSAWHSALQRLNEDRNLAGALGLAARNQFENQHTWKQRADAVVDYCTAAIAVEDSGTTP